MPVRDANDACPAGLKGCVGMPLVVAAPLLAAETMICD